MKTFKVIKETTGESFDVSQWEYAPDGAHFDLDREIRRLSINRTIDALLPFIAVLLTVIAFFLIISFSSEIIHFAT
jgi:hypothetical protein